MGIHTLHVEHVMLLLLYTMLTVANSWLYRGAKGSHWFSLYTLFALLGAVSVACRGSIPDFLSIVVGNLFVVAAYFSLFLSLAALFGRRRNTLLMQAVLCIAGVVTMLQWGWLFPDTKLRLLAYSIVLGLQQALIAVFIMRNKDRTLRKACSPLALMLAALALTNLVRIVGVVLSGAPADYLQSGPFLSWIVMINSCLQCGALVAYVWMTAALLRNDLEVQASTDPLTGLLNRRAMERAANLQLQSGAPAFAITIDLDHFKSINDSFGHYCGDLTLIAVAGTLRANLRDRDLLARMGGDEFAILLPSVAPAEAARVAETLRTAIEALVPVNGSSTIRVTASFGMAPADSPLFDWDRLIIECDKALYAAKRAGGNTALLSPEQHGATQAVAS